MEEYVKRMVDELGELHRKIVKLDNFITCQEANPKIEKEKLNLLILQSNSMKQYETILRMRLRLEGVN